MVICTNTLLNFCIDEKLSAELNWPMLFFTIAFTLVCFYIDVKWGYNSDKED